MLGILAGIQAGVAGGILMLLYFSLQSLMLHKPWWTMANLLGTAVYGQTALWRGLGRATIAGAAFQIIIAGFIGALFGLANAYSVRLANWTSALLVGLASGLASFFLCHDWLYGLISPLIPVYAPRSSALIAHLLFGLALSRVTSIYRAMQPVTIFSS